MKFNIAEMKSKSSDIVESLTRMESLLNEMKDSWVNLASDKSNWDAPSADYFSSVVNHIYDILNDYSSLKNNTNSYFQTVIGNYQRVNNQISGGHSFYKMDDYYSQNNRR